MMTVIDLSSDSDDDTPTQVQKSSTEKQQNLKLGQHCQTLSPKKKKAKVDRIYNKKTLVWDDEDSIDHVVMIWLHRVQSGYKNITIPDEILEEKAKEAACILDLLDKFSPNRWLRGFKVKLKRMQEEGCSKYFNHSKTIRIKEIIDEERPFFSRCIVDGNVPVNMIQEKQERQLWEIEEVHQKQLAQMVEEQKQHYEMVKESQRKQMEEIKIAQQQRYALLLKKEETQLAQLKKVPEVVKDTSYVHVTAPTRAATPICVPSTKRAKATTCTPAPIRTTSIARANCVPLRAPSPSLMAPVRTIGSVTIRPIKPFSVAVPATALAPAPVNASGPVRACAPVSSLMPKTVQVLAPTARSLIAPAPALLPAPAPAVVQTPAPTFTPGPATAIVPAQMYAPAIPNLYETIDLDDVLDDPIQSYEEALDCLTLVENYFLSVRNLKAVLLVSQIEEFLRKLVEL